MLLTLILWGGGGKPAKEELTECELEKCFLPGSTKKEPNPTFFANV